MSRLPQPGGDNGNWGTILNNFLTTSHNPDGTLKAQDDITDAKTKADSAVQSVNGKTGTAITLAATDINAEPVGLSDDTKAALNDSFGALFAPIGRKVLALYDDFSRYADGPLSGRVPVVGNAWATSGVAPTQVVGGMASSSGTGYAFQTLSDYPVIISCEMVWTGSASSMTMAVLDDAQNLNDLRPHFNFSPYGFNATVRKDGGTFDGLLNGVWRTPFPMDGVTSAVVTMVLHGSTFAVIGPNGEVFATSDQRLDPPPGHTIFIEPGGVAYVKKVAVYTEDEAKEFSAFDLIALLAPGFNVAGSGQTLGSQGSSWEVQTGYEYHSGFPGITFGPTVIKTFLTAPVGIGDTTITVNDAVLFSGSAQIESGSNSETLAITGNYGGSPGDGVGHTYTIAAATKAHVAGSFVGVTITGNPPTIYRNAIGGVVIPGNSYLNGTMYLGGNADSTLARVSAGVIAVGGAGAGKGAFKTGSGATAARPAAATVGVGAQWFDTTLGIPIWSNGTAWINAAGAPV